MYKRKIEKLFPSGAIGVVGGGQLGRMFVFEAKRMGYLIKALDGLDSMLSIVQMPGGVPVATVGIDNAKNAGLLAARILGVQNLELYNKLTERANQIKESLIFDLSEKLEASLNSDDIETNAIK